MEYAQLLTKVEAPTGLRVVADAPAVTLEVVTPAFVHRYVCTIAEAQALLTALTQALQAVPAEP